MAAWHFTRFVRRLIKSIGKDDISGAAAELAYKLFLALFPFLIFLAALGGFMARILNVDNPSQQLIDELGNSLPDDVTSVLESQLTQVVDQRNAGLLSVGIIGSVWAASSGVGTIMKVMNRVYDAEESRPLPVKYGLAVGMTLITGIFILGAFLLLVIGQGYGIQIAEELGFQGTGATLVNLARWPIVVFLLLLAVAFLHWAAPNTKLPFRWSSPGALIFVGLWLSFTYLFGIYVSNFGSYNATYGTLGAAVVLMVWLYLSSFILLLSAEVNAVAAKMAAEAEAAKEAKRRGSEPEPPPPPTTREKANKAVPQVAIGAGLVGLTVWRFITQRGQSSS